MPYKLQISKCILGYIYLYVSKHITYFWHWYTSLKQASKNVKEVVLERISAWVIFRCLCIQDTYMYCACQGCISDDSPATYNVDSDLGFLRVRSFLQKKCVFVLSILTLLCFVHPIFRFWFLVNFGNKVRKIWKYYVIFIYILQSRMGKTEKMERKSHN